MMRILVLAFLVAGTLRAEVPKQPAPTWRLDSGALHLDLEFDPTLGLSVRRFVGGPTVCDCRSSSLVPIEAGSVRWTGVKADLRATVSGGRRVEEFCAELESDKLLAVCRILLYPDVSVMRCAWEFVGRRSATSLKCAPLALTWKDPAPGNSMKAVTFSGGRDRYQVGAPTEYRLGDYNDRIRFGSVASYEYAPVLLLEELDAPQSGFLFAVDTLKRWDAMLFRSSSKIQLSLGTVAHVRLAEGERIDSPIFTLVAFAGGRDELMRTVYDWQYRYMWDYTNPDYFAKLRTCPNWVFPGRNAHEQFTWRLACYEAEADRQRETGAEVVWDDAGWSLCATNYPGDSYAGVKINNFEGPDYMVARRAFRKSGLKQLIWFGRKHDLGVLEGKHGAWGEFEWRTDMFYELPAGADELRRDIVDYLERDGNRSFHTCNCGCTYSLMFDIQRFSGFNYLCDLKGGPYHNSALSYFVVPDKLCDLLMFVGTDRGMASDGAMKHVKRPLDEIRYQKAFARARLSMVTMPGNPIHAEDIPALRLDSGIYKYLRARGVVGRGCYMYHPEQWGCESFVYRQRVSADRCRSVLIQAVTPKSRCIVFPRGLLPDEKYGVSFQNSPEKSVRTGRDLMENGFDLRTFTDGELIYLNLPDHPGSGNCPKPGPVCGLFARADEAFGRSGVGVYWSPCAGDPDCFWWEVAKNGEVIGRPAFGTYWFDSAAGALPSRATYSVRAVNYDGTVGPWTEFAFDGSAGTGIFSPLGGFGKDMGRSGWRAEFSPDGNSFEPMKWVPPAKSALADIGGTPNQVGGIEGYFEGGACGRVGRGWMQADVAGFAALSFAVPRDGRLAVSGRAMKEFYHRAAGGSQAAFVLLNGRKVAEGRLEPNDLNGFSHDLALDVRTGDLLRFVVGPGGGRPVVHHDATARLVGWLPRLAYEPPTETARPSVVSFSDFGAGCSVGRSIALPQGTYTVKMTWLAREGQLFDENDICVWINGTQVERGFDVRSFSRGRGGEVVRLYRYRVPTAEGRMEIAVDGKATLPLVRIDIAPEFRPIVRLNCGSDGSFPDWAGDVWSADDLCRGGVPVKFGGASVKQATPTIYDQELYRTAWSGRDLVWRVPVPAGIYGVQLKLAELGGARTGDRTLDVFVNGRPVRLGYDTVAVAGSVGQAADVRFEGVVPEGGMIEVRVKATGRLPAIVQGLMVE